MQVFFLLACKQFSKTGTELEAYGLQVLIFIIGIHMSGGIFTRLFWTLGKDNTWVLRKTASIVNFFQTKLVWPRLSQWF